MTSSCEFAYLVEDGKPAAVTTKTLNNTGGQVASYVLYDGFLRERQTQAPGPSGGSILTDVFYDGRGQAVRTFAPYYSTGKPSTVLFKPENALSVETQTRTVFDGQCFAYDYLSRLTEAWTQNTTTWEGHLVDNPQG
ncbi:hypothetical protein [Streptomyces sp. NPDC091212]|uniref:hypothetical protein n=1 Tax=Streptomyces sp. NPDC091212 TaxID=3155191 RepID=UPI003414EEC4